jgi:FkbH-like protein
MSLLQRKLAWRQVIRGRDSAMAVRRVSVLATFTSNALEPLLGMAAHDEDLAIALHTGPYDQIRSECLNPASETAEQRPDVLIVWPQLEDLWRTHELPLVDTVERYTSDITELAEISIQAARRMEATLVFVLPHVPELRPLGVGDHANPVGVCAAAEAARAALRTVLQGSGALVADADAAIRSLGYRAALDPRLFTTARVPYTEAAFHEVALQIARLLRLQYKGAKKVAVVDADNTLWGGVVGEDGADGIDLLDNGPGEAHRAFQGWLRELRRAGTIVALASKNNEEDLWPAFERREMVLKRDEVAAFRINWDPKPLNLSELADELNLGTASMVFIDDNPAEIEAMRSGLPEVQSVRMPEDVSQWIRDVAGTGALDRLVPTSADLHRAEGYRVETERRALRDAIHRETLDPDAYLRSLEIEVRLFDPDAADLGRLAQLIAKTNQFTIGGPRHTEAELRAMLTSGDHVVRLASAQDRFGEYGVVGATIIHRVADVSRLDSFVLSCRAMGRGVEDAMICDAVRISEQQLHVVVEETPKNMPGRSFFAKLGVGVATPTVLRVALWPDAVRNGG